MLDIKFILENQALIKETAKNKNISFSVDVLIQTYNERNTLLKEVEAIRELKNKTSELIPRLNPQEKLKKLQEMRDISTKEKNLNKSLKAIEEKYKHLMLLAPQPTSQETPVGKEDSDNKELYKIGNIPNFDFEPKGHVKLGEDLGLIDIPRGVKISGARNYFLVGKGAQLEQAVINFVLDFLRKKEYTQLSIPTLVKDMAMIGTSYFPGGEEQAYRVEKDELNLVGTSEVALASYHANEILKEDQLPIKMFATSQCFRREAGTYGKDTHGLYRVHQFQKVEQVFIGKNNHEESTKLHNELLNNAEEILKALNLPYRVVQVCTGDIGQGQYHKHDIETWMPSRNNYAETHSCSTFLEFQSRRLKIRYKDSENNTQFCHTLNNTAIAAPRILIPLLECNQNADGSINIPEALQPYMGGMTKISK